MFIKSSKDEILRDLQQNMIIPFHTIHDEIDIIVDSNILEGVAKRISQLGAIKSTMDKVGTNTIDFAFDLEYNDTGDFLPKKSFSAHNLPINQQERDALDFLIETPSQVEHIQITGNLQEFKKTLRYDTNGVVVTITTPDNKQITGSQLINKDSVLEFNNKGQHNAK